MEEEGTTRGSYDGKYVVKYSFPKNTSFFITRLAKLSVNFLFEHLPSFISRMCNLKDYQFPDHHIGL
jgi:hypothetical protein